MKALISLVTISLIVSLSLLLLPVKAQEPLLIRITVDGQVEGTSTIQRNGNVYTLTSNHERGSIVIEASNVVLDGAGFILGEIYRIDGDNVEIKNLKINAEVNAIEIYGSGCKLLDNEIQARYMGIRIRESDNNVISGNEIYTEGTGISFETSKYNEIKANNVNSKERESVSLSNSDHNTFSKNTLNFVSLYKSSFNVFEENNLLQGISIRSHSDNNKIISNNIKDFNKVTNPLPESSGSISLFNCKANTITSNKISNSGGIFLDTSSENVLKNNCIESAKAGFEVSAPSYPSSSFVNDIDNSNTINGQIIYYLTDKTDLTINPQTYPNAGYLALVNCKHITVENLSIKSQGIMLAFTTDSTIRNNDISNNYGNGISLNSALNNRIENNRIDSNNKVGIVLSSSNQNTVSGNSVRRNGDGISFVYSSNNNTITQNNIADQHIGIYFYVSSNNLLYSNNFINNTNQIQDASGSTSKTGSPGMPSPSINVWNIDLPHGGNYWSDYASQYPNAQELDNSDIWDIPRFIDENNEDPYPLMKPVVISESPNQTDNNRTEESEAFPILPITATIAIVLISLGIGFHVYFKKRNRAFS